MSTDLMIDLETLDTTVTAKILSVGLCFFDIATGEVRLQTDVTVPLAGQEKRTVSDAALNWWMTQTDKAWSLARGGEQTELRKLLHAISDNVKMFPGIRVWGNGATFDISILEHAFNEYGIPVPWDFWNVRDMRTLVEVGQMITGVGIRSKVPFEGVKHSAVDDAVWQAKVVSEIWKVLG